MLKKQDRQGVRTAADLERKYNFTKMMGASEGAHQINGFVSFSIDDDGNLYVITSGGGEPPVFEYDEATGNLYYITEEG